MFDKEISMVPHPENGKFDDLKKQLGKFDDASLVNHALSLLQFLVNEENSGKSLIIYDENSKEAKKYTAKTLEKA